MKRSFEPAQLETFRTLLTQRLGLHFAESKLVELADVLHRRMAATDSPQAGRYFDLLAASGEELRSVAAQVTVPETYFFRVTDHFRALAECVLPQRMERQNGRRQLSFLSAGCASGEEPYSLAMVLSARPELTGWQLDIRGIDINSVVLGKAKAGRYSPWSLRETDPDLQKRYFRAHGRDFLLHESIRRMVSFDEGNLADGRASFWRTGAYDVIFFRNVLMYLTPETGQEVVGRLAESLAPEGYLFLGPAESLRGVSQQFHLCHTHGTFYYQRRPQGVSVPGPQSSPTAAPFRETHEARSLAPISLPETGGGWIEVIRHAAVRIEKLSKSPDARGEVIGRAELSEVRDPGSLADMSTALNLLQRERFAEALEILQRFPATAQTSADVQLLRAVLLANRGELAPAREACAAVLRADEFSAGAHYVLALCSEHAGQPGIAMDHDRTAAYLDHSFAMPHLHLGLLAKRRDEPAVARQELKLAALLLAREDPSRILLFGGGFSREALAELCRRELETCGDQT
jgi:chemotaxis protein methyltransferase CheR